MTEPKRLRDQPDVPPQLQAALQMMEQNTTPPEVVERVQRAIAGLPNATGVGGLAFGWGGAVSAVAVAVAVAAAVAWMRRPHAGEEASRLEASVARHERAQIAASEPKGDPALAAVSCDAADVSSPVTPEPPPSIVARVPTPRVAAALGRRTRQKAVGSSAEPRVDGDEARSHPGSSAQDIAPADSARVAAVEEPAPAGVTQVEEGPEPAAAEDVPPRPVVLNPPVPEDEASLVYRAKRLARTDHAAAWDLIEAHAKHFPDGALAPEREVLAIDLLGRMGREQEAKQRLARFMVRFPESGYRNIVTRSAADPQ